MPRITEPKEDDQDQPPALITENQYIKMLLEQQNAYLEQLNVKQDIIINKQNSIIEILNEKD